MDTEKPEFQHKQILDGYEVAVEAGESQPSEPMPKWPWEEETPTE